MNQEGISTAYEIFIGLVQDHSYTVEGALSVSNIMANAGYTVKDLKSRDTEHLEEWDKFYEQRERISIS